MNEEKTQSEETTTEDSNAGSEPKTTDKLELADQTAERLERANTKKEELLDREEALMVQARLSGTALAGSQPEPKETEDDKWKREAKLRYEGTGMDPTE